MSRKVTYFNSSYQSSIQTPLQYFGSDLFQWQNSEKSIVIKDGMSNVERWQDLTPNGADMVWNGVQKPVFVDNILNGKGTIEFTQNDYLESVLPKSAYRFMHDGSKFSIFAVFRINSAVGDLIKYVASTGIASVGQVGYMLTSYNEIIYGSRNVRDTTYTAVSTLSKVHRYIWSSVTNINDSSNPIASSRSTIIDNITGNTRNNNSYSSNPFTVDPTNTLRFGQSLYGYLSEVMIIKRLLTSTDIGFLQNWINSEWGL